MTSSPCGDFFRIPLGPELGLALPWSVWPRFSRSILSCRWSLKPDIHLQNHTCTRTCRIQSHWKPRFNSKLYTHLWRHTVVSNIKTRVNDKHLQIYYYCKAFLFLLVCLALKYLYICRVVQAISYTYQATPCRDGATPSLGRCLPGSTRPTDRVLFGSTAAGPLGQIHSMLLTLVPWSKCTEILEKQATLSEFSVHLWRHAIVWTVRYYVIMDFESSIIF